MAVVRRFIEILTVGVLFFASRGVFHSQDSVPSTFRPRLWETSSGVVAVGVFAAEPPKSQLAYIYFFCGKELEATALSHPQ